MGHVGAILRALLFWPWMNDMSDSTIMHLGILALGLIIGLVVGYRLALSAAAWGLRASVEARDGQKGLFGPPQGSPEVQMAEERERWLVGTTVSERGATATATLAGGEDELDED